MSRPDENDRFVYEFGRFVVDPLDKTIVVDGRSIQLPAKEFETLLLLIENNGRVVTKSDMMSALWQDTFVEEGNLATYISRLRKIVNKDGEKLIETVPKLGYRFTADLRKNFLDSNGAIVVEKRTIKTLEVELESAGQACDDKNCVDRGLTISFNKYRRQWPSPGPRDHRCFDLKDRKRSPGSRAPDKRGRPFLEFRAGFN